MQNHNSLLFYEVMYKCGDPFSEKEKTNNGWIENAKEDIAGPEADTINALTMNGMTYIKLKTGSLVQFWLFDTGSSDLLINNDMEKSLKNEGLFATDNYLGTGEYEMANGVIDTCRNIWLIIFKLENLR